VETPDSQPRPGSPAPLEDAGALDLGPRAGAGHRAGPDAEPAIVAAGAVVLRKGPQVLLVHRPKYDDWSFPKGKVDPGEHVLTAAVREVAEETGIDIRLGPPLPDQDYLVGNGTLRLKRVHYWTGRAVAGDDVSDYRPNAEIDEVRWVDLDAAADLLTYPRDAETLAAVGDLRRRTTPLVVLRHGKATSRKAWRGDDRQRPLSELGELQSEELVPMLGAYGVRRILSSSSQRCWTSVAPYADVADLDLEVTPDLSEEDADADGVTDWVHTLLAGKEPAVLCTHRPVLPLVLAALGLEERRMEPGAMLVAHHRRGRLVAVEEHPPHATADDVD
jgi:8-oxo-dGTP diphosphatase